MTAVGNHPTATARLLLGLGAMTDRLDLSAHLALHGALPEFPPRRAQDELISLLGEAGLRGRGGAGFPTARKLQAIAGIRRRPMVVVNAMEGEPASLKDQVLASQNPHLVLDGAQIVARSMGASAIIVCVARNNMAASDSFERALIEREYAGLLTVPCTVRQPPPRYIAGEESALAQWLDGGESIPKFRADRPSIPRVDGQPALVDNAETLAHVALIARHGAAWFRSVGTPEAPGTTLVTVSGIVERPRIVEVPFGATVSEILTRAGVLGPLGGVLLGGYGGTWLGGSEVARSYDPHSLRATGCDTGVGVMVALPSTGCGIAETARITRWMAGESAGQCGPCAFGLPAMADDLAELAFSHPTRQGADRLRARMEVVNGRGACRHPDGVVRLVRSAFRAFADDVEYHLVHGPCAGTRHAIGLPFPHHGTADTWR